MKGWVDHARIMQGLQITIRRRSERRGLPENNTFLCNLQATLVNGVQSLVSTLTANAQKGWKVDPVTSGYARLDLTNEQSTVNDDHKLQVSVTSSLQGGTMTAKTLVLDADMVTTANRVNTWTLAPAQQGSTTTYDLSISSPMVTTTTTTSVPVVKIGNTQEQATGTSLKLMGTAALETWKIGSPNLLQWKVQSIGDDLLLEADKDNTNDAAKVGFGT